jgi:hypothetical protein
MPLPASSRPSAPRGLASDGTGPSPQEVASVRKKKELAMTTRDLDDDEIYTLIKYQEQMRDDAIGTSA